MNHEETLPRDERVGQFTTVALIPVRGLRYRQAR